MINILKKNEVITLYRQGQGIKRIARDTGLSKNTVKKYIREYTELASQLVSATSDEAVAVIQDEMCSRPKSKHHKKPNSKFTPEVEQRFWELIHIAEEKDRILGRNKQTLTAAHLHRVLVREGYDIGETTVKVHFREYKQAHPECFIKQYYEYGDRAEFDFHQIRVVIGNEKRDYYQMTVTVNASGHIYGLLFHNQTSSAVMTAIVKFIRHCNGVIREFVFDNMSPIVKRFITDGEKQYTDMILNLSSYYGFKIVTCNPRSGNEKGTVENAGKNIRNEFFSLKYQFSSEDELFAYYQSELDKYNNATDPKWNEEKKYLLAKPADYLICDIRPGTVNSYSFVSVDTNFYSVPDKYVGKKVIIHIFEKHISVYDGNQMIASHTKKNGFSEYSIDISHFINTFRKKPGALRNSLALRQAPETLKRLFYHEYSMDAKKFIDDLYNDSLKMSENKSDSIEKTSQMQLTAISKVFGLGGICEQDRTACH